MIVIALSRPLGLRPLAALRKRATTLRHSPPSALFSSDMEPDSGAQGAVINSQDWEAIADQMRQQDEARETLIKRTRGERQAAPRAASGRAGGRSSSSWAGRCGDHCALYALLPLKRNSCALHSPRRPEACQAGDLQPAPWRQRARGQAAAASR